MNTQVQNAPALSTANLRVNADWISATTVFSVHFREAEPYATLEDGTTLTRPCVKIYHSPESQPDDLRYHCVWVPRPNSKGFTALAAMLGIERPETNEENYLEVAQTLAKMLHDKNNGIKGKPFAFVMFAKNKPDEEKGKVIGLQKNRLYNGLFFDRITAPLTERQQQFLADFMDGKYPDRKIISLNTTVAGIKMNLKVGRDAFGPVAYGVPFTATNSVG